MLFPCFFNIQNIIL